MRACVAFLAALAAVCSSAQPLPLPNDPSGTCTAGALRRVTEAEPTCASTIITGQASPECCQALASSHGPNSTLPTRNCFCVPEYWEDLAAKQTHSTISLTTYLDSCSALGYPVYYYQAGEGPCSGVPVAPTSDGGADAGSTDSGSAAEVTPLPMRSLGQWLRDLGDDGIILVSFIVAVAAAVGGSLMLWSFVYDFYASLSSKARKQV